MESNFDSLDGVEASFVLTLFGLLSGFAEVSKSKAAGPAGGLVILRIQKKCRLLVDCAWVCLPTTLQLERLVIILRTPFESPWSKETSNTFLGLHLRVC